jgi:hypothetical protein
MNTLTYSEGRTTYITAAAANPIELHGDPVSRKLCVDKKNIRRGNRRCFLRLMLLRATIVAGEPIIGSDPTPIGGEETRKVS